MNNQHKRFWGLMLTTLLSLLGCKPGINDKTLDPMKEYRWSITESAPKEYAITIISGHMEAADGYQKGIPTRALVYSGWGRGRSNIVAGREEMPLPKRMEITWFSYREDTFYHGAFELPFERIQHIVSQMDKRPYSGLRNKNHTFTLGIAPQGFLVIWLSATNHKRVIFTGQAKEVEGIPWKVIFDNPKYSKEEIMEETIADTLKGLEGSPQINDPTYWQRIHQELYTYDIVIEGEYTPYSFGSRFLDKSAHKFISDDQRWTEEPKSLLEKISFEYFFPTRFPVVSIRNINPDEMYAAFRQLSKTGSPLRVVIRVEGDLINSWGYQARIRVENDEESIVIEQFDFKRVDTSDFMDDVKASKNLMRYMNYPGKPATP